MTNKVGFFFKSFGILLGEYIRYKCSKNYDRFIIKIVDKLAEQNIFYVKIIQALSTNSHFLTDDLISYMSKYTDNIPYTDEDINDDCFRDICLYNLANPEKKLLLDTGNPIKAGTVSLVYKGTYKNRMVVVKIVRKNIKENIVDMLENLNGVIKLLGKLPQFRSIHLYEIFEENKELLIQQTDFNKEVKHMQTMQKNYKNLSEYIIPIVYPDFTKLNSNMIVMDFIDGQTLYDVDKDDTKFYSKLITKFGIKNILFNRLYHADLHPGNILFIKTPENEHKIGILDFGIMGELAKDEQDEFYQFMIVLFSENVDYKAVIEMLLKYYIEPQERIQELKVKEKAIIDKEITNIIKLAISNCGNLGADELFNINKILIQYKLKLARNFCKILLAMAISESVTMKIGSNNKQYDSMLETMKELFPTYLLEY